MQTEQNSIAPEQIAVVGDGQRGELAAMAWMNSRMDCLFHRSDGWRRPTGCIPWLCRCRRGSSWAGPIIADRSTEPQNSYNFATNSFGDFLCFVM